MPPRRGPRRPRRHDGSGRRTRPRPSTCASTSPPNHLPRRRPERRTGCPPHLQVCGKGAEDRWSTCGGVYKQVGGIASNMRGGSELLTVIKASLLGSSVPSSDARLGGLG